jgi:uncharacterized protein
MRFFRSEGLAYLQFIPAMDFQSVEPEKPPAYLITPAEYGDFLVALFDEWYEGGFPTTSVRTFDAILQSYIGVPSGLCVYSERCDNGIVVEYNGDVYPCDFYISDVRRLGNVLEEPLESVLAKPERLAFIAHKAPLPPQCEACQWQRLCNGGCPRNRTGGETPEYFCESHRRLFAHADEGFRELANRIRRRLVVARARGPALVREGRAARRNEPCPCDSGRKYKLCCGDPRASGSYLLRL